MQNIPFFHNYDPLNKRFTIRGATHFPKEIFNFANEIEILDASDCLLSSLPNDFALLYNLKVAFFNKNLFEEIPKVLAECVRLQMVSFKSCKINTFAEDTLPKTIRWLVLTQNNLTKLPTFLGNLHNLQKLSLAGNRLQSLPNEMASCRRLELVRISANDFNSPPPDWLFTLPRLAWYGDNGNPFSKKSPTEQELLANFSWDEIEFENLIGESPSSCVYKGMLKKNQQPIAIKVFKGELTSDGLPEDDMRASIAAGTQDNLIKILGKLTHNYEKKEGLVLTLIPPTYKSLGLPPNLNTCTRDTYPPQTSFSLPTIVTILKGITLACQHLHSKGIMHGDLYAHNILTNGSGHSLLGDFGAASFYDPKISQAREQLDVRAFGCLVEELLSHSEKEGAGATFDKLHNLQQACMSEVLTERPLFSEILSQFFQS